jgi:hypothetical protein
MRLASALVVAFIVAACSVQQSSSERSFVRGENARSAQAALDAEAILRGMAQARNASEWVARDIHQNEPGAAPSAITR